MSDYEIDQIRQVRHRISSENDHDLEKLSEYYRRVEQELRESGRYHFADEPPKGAASALTEILRT